MKTAGLIAAVAASALVAGCASDPRAGYSFGDTTPEGVRTVRVPIFRNQTYNPGIETELTEAIIKKIQSDTGLRVVQSGGADSELRGVVTDVDMQTLSLAPGSGLVQEIALTIRVDYDWIDTRTGRVLVGRRNFAGSDTFVPSRPTGEPIETGEHGAVQRVANDLVGTMRGAW
jgi:hypothetical protein